MGERSERSARVTCQHAIAECRPQRAYGRVLSPNPHSTYCVEPNCWPGSNYGRFRIGVLILTSKLVAVFTAPLSTLYVSGGLVKNDYLLPRKAAMDNVFALLDEIRNRPNSREADMRKWVKELSRSQHALVQWGLVDDSGGRLTFTGPGEAIAWSNERDRDDLLVQHVVLGYEPYEVIVLHHLKEWSSTLTTEEVLPIWARNLGITLGRGEMSASAATMFGLMERAGLGRYFIGRGGKPTRIEFNADAKSRIQAAQTLAQDQDGEEKPPENDARETEPPQDESAKVVASSVPEPQVRRVVEHVARRDPVAVRRQTDWGRKSAHRFEDPDAGFEVYRRPGLEIKIRPTEENIKKGIQFLRMLEPEEENE